MAGFLSNFRNTFLAGLALAAIFMFGFGMHGSGFNEVFAQGVFRALHTFFGVLWIGLLYYFNFVQIRIMPSVPAELKPGITKHIAPEALFWFRYAALFTVIMGLILAYQRGYLMQALSLGLMGGDTHFLFIGLGMWLGLIMFMNVWMFIWPAQKIALGLVEGDADAKAAAGKKAMVFSRINTLLSLPMLVCMTMYQTTFG